VIEHSSAFTGIQIDLLKSAFLQGNEALPAWGRWRDWADWDGHFDHDTFALLPHVYSNLNSLGAHDALMPRFKGIRRQAWLANQLWIQKLSESLDTCFRERIEFLFLPPTLDLLLDDSAVMVQGQPVRLAVPERQSEAAIRCLLEAGWKCTEITLPRRSLTGFAIGARHLLLRHDSGFNMSLNWGMKWMFADGIDEVWTRVVKASIGGHTVNVPDATDALEFALRQPLMNRPLGQAAEILILSRNPRLDWQRLNAAARTLSLGPDWKRVLVPILPLLRQWGAPEDPPGWCHADPERPDPDRMSMLRRGRDGWRAYRTRPELHHSLNMALRQLPGYLVGRFNISSAWKIPLGALRWAVRK